MNKTRKKFTSLLGAFALVATLSATAFSGGNVFADSSYCNDINANEAECTIPVDDFGYGRFDVYFEGEGYKGASDYDTRTFYYYPAYATLVKENGKYYIDVYYNWDDMSEEQTGDVAQVIIKVHPAGNSEEMTFEPIDVQLNAGGVTRVELPFEENSIDDGEYVVEVYAYNRDGQMLTEEPYTFVISYSSDAGANALNVPDTGEIAKAANISQADFLVTGLIIFGIVAVAGVTFILRGDKRKATAKVSARNAKSASSRAKTRRK